MFFYALRACARSWLALLIAKLNQIYRLTVTGKEQIFKNEVETANFATAEELKRKHLFC